MRGAYVDGGGHMVANLIKSTHIEYKLGVTKMPWGLLHTLSVDQKNIVKCWERQSLLPAIWTSVMEPFQGIDPISVKEIGQLKQMLPLKAKWIFCSVANIYFNIQWNPSDKI